MTFFPRHVGDQRVDSTGLEAELLASQWTDPPDQWLIHLRGMSPPNMGYEKMEGKQPSDSVAWLSQPY